MTTSLINFLASALAGVLLLFTVRRLAFIVAAWLQSPPIGQCQQLPSVALLIPARDEAAGIGRTLAAVAALDYPPDLLFTVLIDDGSRDATAQLLEQWAAGRERTVVLSSIVSRGKIEAMNAGIAVAPATELIAVCDADVQPRADWMRRLADAFSDDEVGGAAALLWPVAAAITPVSRYASVESWAHQLVTSAAKDRLNLNPMTNGGSAYRRSALEPLGWFGVGFSEDDVRATVALTRAGWRTRLVESAVAEHTVVHAFADYWRQHIRWSGNLFAASAAPGGSRRTRVSVIRQIETWFVSAGYLDRLVFLAVVALVVFGPLPVWVPVIYVAAIVGHVASALAKARTGARSVAFFISTAAFYAVDVVASFVAIAGQLRRGPHVPPRMRR